MIDFLIYKVICRAYWRLNAVIGYILLTAFAIFYVAFSERTWEELYAETMEVVKANWNKY